MGLGGFGEEALGYSLKLLIELEGMVGETVNPGRRGWIWKWLWARGCAIEEFMGMVAKAAKGVYSKGEENDAIVEDGCEISGVVDMTRVCQLSPGARKMGLVQCICRG